MLSKLLTFFRPSGETHKLQEPVTEAIRPQTVSLAASYSAKVKEELKRFQEVTDVHALPPIADYWSNKYLLPMFKECGFDSVDHFYAKYLLAAAQRTSGPARFISIGAGNCDLEIRVAKLLNDMGLHEFTLECLELNTAMLARGRLDAAQTGTINNLVFTEADFNAWSPSDRYSAVMANHSLHHVLKLEGLFDSIKSSLRRNGYFITADMIGRNGHQRWPEAMTVVDRFWKRLPEGYKYNQLLRRHEPSYVNWDCSSEGFEGIRAQEILALLIERFDFTLFLGFANAIGPFIDRCFGHNFDPTSASDRAVIDSIHEADEEGFRTGALKPTQMFAVMSVESPQTRVYARGLSPEMALRKC